MPAEPVLRACMQYLIAFCSQPETASDVISGIVVRSIVNDKHEKFCDLRLNRSRQIPPEAIGGGIFDRFINFNNCQPEVSSDVMSGVVVEPTDIGSYKS